MLKSLFHSLAWHIWRRKTVRQWIERMETARKLFPIHYSWSPMRATADVLATVDQHLSFYINPKGGASRREEVKALRDYEAKLLSQLELQIKSGNYTESEANEVIDMLADYSSVQSTAYQPLIAQLEESR